MNQEIENNVVSIFDRMIDINDEIKSETGIDLLVKSPQALALLCIAEAMNNLNYKADSIAYALSDVSSSIYSLQGGRRHD